MYPLFHPDRPYFVNLAYLYDEIIYLFRIFFDITYGDINPHYSKYEGMFGPEEKLPGFLMSNQQVIKLIQFQTRCGKYQNND